ncbi:hypothetical protein NG42_17570 [Winslowiella iniecta]|uniref:Type I restriction modification DNA specificity domain-containing protein n=1 Tax=Winslowiella iniecta TaxID=1560201 RepID=A0A0L7SY91_9GAMM|nr:hypothetical protein NG42_17570 [Winslowiella iniecta]KOC88146.1 hypothetical protein NG43_20670 [Winslowiella iniecta]
MWLSRKALDCFIQISTNKKNVKTKDCKSEGLYPVIDQGQQFICGYIDDESKVIKISSPLCVFGDHTRVIKWVTQDFVPGADGTKILEAEKFIFPKYGYYALRFIDIPDKGYSRHFKYLKELEIPISSLAEQKIIADKLDDLLARVESIKTRLENIPEILKKFRQSVLSAAVSGKLTEEWRNSDSFGENIFLGDLISSGPQNGLYKPSSFYGRGTKIIRIDSFYDGEIIDWEKIKKVELSKGELDKWALRKNDVLINRVNSREYLGKCALVKSMPSECVFESNIMRLSLIEEKVIPEYIILYLCSEKGVSELRKNAKLAVNQASINQDDVKNCIILLPNIDEQKEIIRRVNICFSYSDKVSENVFIALSKVNVIAQSIIAKAFRGELTAQWREENPELISGLNSAEALLERITAEKLASGTIKKRTKKTSH